MSSESQIMFVGVSPKDLVELISENVKMQIQNFVLDTPQVKQKDEPELITRKEAADLLKVSLVTIHEWSRNGLLTHYKLGNRTYYNREEILEKVYASNRKKI